MASKKTFLTKIYDLSIMFKFCKSNYSLLLIFLVVTSLLSACGNDKSIKCREIITIAVKLDKETKNKLTDQNPNNVLKVADIFDNSAKEIKNIKIKDEQLNKYNQELGAIYQNYAQSTRNFVKAFEEKDLDKALFEKEQISQLFQRQQTLVNDINNYCAL